MIKTIKKLFGSTDYIQLIEEGAIIVDVRHKIEFKQGHVKGAVNVPMDKIARTIPKLQKRNRPVITISGTGASSATAKSQLKAAGIEAYNGGPWQKFARYANQHAKAQMAENGLN